MERDHRGQEGFSCGALMLAFLTGTLLGAGAALLMAPESGLSDAETAEARRENRAGRARRCGR